MFFGLALDVDRLDALVNKEHISERDMLEQQEDFIQYYEDMIQNFKNLLPQIQESLLSLYEKIPKSCHS